MILVWCSVFQWSEKRRCEIAGLMCSILRAHLQAHDPLFSMTLRYLIRFDAPLWWFFYIACLSLFLLLLVLLKSVYTRSSAFVKESPHPYQTLLKGCFLRKKMPQQRPKSHYMKCLHLMRWFCPPFSIVYFPLGYLCLIMWCLAL